jgi:hypothetical protein
MPVPADAVPWAGSLLWLVGLALAAFAVSWVVANVWRVRRTAYVGVLTAVTAAYTVGYVWWLGIDATSLLTTHWVWALVATPFASAFLVFGMAKLPAVQHLRGRRLVVTLAWEAVVYGTAEGVLLSALPAFMAWQMVHSLGWSGIPGGVARAAVPLAASVAVVVVHHLGYWEYRNRLLAPISIGCGLLTVGYLLTANPVTAALGHVAGHVAALAHGADLPPHPHASPTASLVHTLRTTGGGPSAAGLEVRDDDRRT